MMHDMRRPKKLGPVWDMMGGAYGSVVQAPGFRPRVYASMHGGLGIYEPLVDGLEKWGTRGFTLQDAYEGCVYWDAFDRTFRALYSIRGRGLCHSWSTDGIRWQPWSLLLRRGCDSSASVVLNHQAGTYGVYLRAWMLVGRKWSRVVVRAEVSRIEDLVHFDTDPEEWSIHASGMPPIVVNESHYPFETVLAWDQKQDADWYTMSAVKTESGYLAFPSKYTHHQIMEGDDVDSELSEGTTEIHVARSIDGRVWQVSELPYVCRGNAWQSDCGCTYMYNGYLVDGSRVLEVYFGNIYSHTNRRRLSIVELEESGARQMIGVVEHDRTWFEGFAGAPLR